MIMLMCIVVTRCVSDEGLKHQTELCKFIDIMCIKEFGFYNSVLWRIRKRIAAINIQWQL